MELKSYQRNVLDDVRAFAEQFALTGDAATAYKLYCKSQGLEIGPGKDMPKYKDKLDGVPRVCIKVPTGGGKTFIGANAPRILFDALPGGVRTVVWMVPRNEILMQTLRQFRNPQHFTRRILDRDFNGRVEVLDKEDGLAGRGFSIATVADQLTVFVLSYDSFKNKDGRRAFKENSAVAALCAYQRANGDAVEIDGAAPDSLVSAIAGTNPLVIVDESHHATSKLSNDMLKSLNPRFVLELSATPARDSNVVTQACARDLKRAQMVKLPVIVYRRGGKAKVVEDAIALQMRLEQHALENERITGDYIRPIVLLQAERRGAEDAETFRKLKAKLVDGCNIPEEQVAIRTGDVNELKGVDLMSRSCPVRYVITIDALAEGWDCPFAYVLATVANKNSQVSVEQIVGRVLRQPYVHRAAARTLNASYVLTSSADFDATLDQVVRGLNGAGFEEDDVVADSSEQAAPIIEQQVALLAEDLNDEPETLDDFVFRAPMPASSGGAGIENILEDAAEKEEAFEAVADTAEPSGDRIGAGMAENMAFSMKPVFAQDVENVHLPMYEIFNDGGNGLFDVGGWQLFENDMLLEDFDLKRHGVDGIDWSPSGMDGIRAIDLSDVDDGFKIKRVAPEQLRAMRTLFDGLSEDGKRNSVIARVCEAFSPQFRNKYGEKQIKDYVTRIVGLMAFDEVESAYDGFYSLARVVRDTVESIAEAHCKRRFEDMLATGRIRLDNEAYSFPTSFYISKPFDQFEKSLYAAEEGFGLDGFERQVVEELANCRNVAWWHRIVQKRKGEYRINGYVNHYPDFVAMTNSGALLLIESKGGHIGSEKTRDKLLLGTQLADKTGGKVRYFMVFDENPMQAAGSYSFDAFKSNILPNLM